MREKIIKRNVIFNCFLQGDLENYGFNVVFVLPYTFAKYFANNLKYKKAKSNFLEKVV